MVPNYNTINKQLRESNSFVYQLGANWDADDAGPYIANYSLKMTGMGLFDMAALEVDAETFYFLSTEKENDQPKGGQIRSIPGDSGGPWILCEINTTSGLDHTTITAAKSCKLFAITARGNPQGGRTLATPLRDTNVELGSLVGN